MYQIMSFSGSFDVKKTYILRKTPRLFGSYSLTALFEVGGGEHHILIVSPSKIIGAIEEKFVCLPSGGALSVYRPSKPRCNVRCDHKGANRLFYCRGRCGGTRLYLLVQGDFPRLPHLPVYAGED